MSEKRAANFKDMTGQRFERLTAVSVSKRVGKRLFWLCQCDCGNTKEVSSAHLRSGNVRSCGCLAGERTRERSTKHGQSGSGNRKLRSLEYKTWAAMKSRCYYPKNISYRNYGGRGIKVCDRWRDSFEAFLEDMGKRPSTRHTLDRIDSNGHYEPSNCRWATYTEQLRNRKTVKLLTFNGATKCIPEWADELGISASKIRARLKRGWTVENALTESVDATDSTIGT